MTGSKTLSMQASLFDDDAALQPSLNQSQKALEEEVVRSMLDQLLEDSRLYRSSKSCKELLEFTVKLRNFAPFNALLLQIQKPGLMYAASASDWRERFQRTPKQDARPLLILWPFGPVALVYDLEDTEGEPLPQDVNPFATIGTMNAGTLQGFIDRLIRKNVRVDWIDAGSGKAGSIQTLKAVADDMGPRSYRLAINKNHQPATQFATLAHELGHLYLGHLGQDRKMNIPPRTFLADSIRELEAESVAYMVCWRQGVSPCSESYLNKFVEKDTDVLSLDLYQIMRAAGQIEALLGLTAHTRFDRPSAD